MKALVFPSSASPSLFFFSNNSSCSYFSPLKFPLHQQKQLKISPFICLSSSTSSSLVEEQQQDSTGNLVETVDDPSNDLYGFPVNFSGCKACGRAEIESGCDGEGRIQGGIGTIPGFGWWPIKAYRPCPGFVASGGNYRRRGQSMDEVASGRGRRVTSMDDSDEFETRKKGKNRRQFKG